MSGHTPGPWSVFDDNGSQRLIVNEATTIAKTMCGNDKANARLIAAAPIQHAELLACKQFLEDMHTQPAEWTVAESQKRHIAVCAAIAEATGEQA